MYTRLANSIITLLVNSIIKILAKISQSICSVINL